MTAKKTTPAPDAAKAAAPATETVVSATAITTTAPAAPTIVNDAVAIDPGEDQYVVRDLNAVTAPREHILRRTNGDLVSVTFPRLPAGILLPANLAHPLTKIEGFEVKDSEGNLKRTVISSETSKAFQLRPDEVIAKYSDLTVEALRDLAEAEKIEGFERMKKADLVDRLIAKPLADDAIGRTAPDTDVDEDDLEVDLGDEDDTEE